MAPEYAQQSKQMGYLDRFAQDESVPMFKGQTQRVECWLTRFTVNNLLFICKANGWGPSMAVAMAVNKLAAQAKAAVPRNPNDNRVYAQPRQTKKKEAQNNEGPDQTPAPECPPKESPPSVRDLEIPRDG